MRIAAATGSPKEEKKGKRTRGKGGWGREEFCPPGFGLHIHIHIHMLVVPCQPDINGWRERAFAHSRACTDVASSVAVDKAQLKPK